MNITNTSPTQEPLLSKRELAVALKVTERSVTIWMKRHRIPHYKLGRQRTRFRLSEVLTRFANNFGN